jgi:hypothetical protein
MIKRLLLTFIFVFATVVISFSQCTTTNATSCQCKVIGQTDCDLLPDIGIGLPPLYDSLNANGYGYEEHAQTGNPNPIDNGRLYITVSTTNVGHGPLELRATNKFVCGTDTFTGTPPLFCPDGNTYPKILVDQRIYHKSGNTMTSYDLHAGSMTYHPAHGHMHVDNWGIYTLRVQNPLDPDPTHWDILGTGAKLAFCVENYGLCSSPTWVNNCTDSAGNPLNNNSDFPNYNLGLNYACSPTVQGITVGKLDAYWTTLEGMYIDIPPGTCNGQYYVVIQVDPNNNFIEEQEFNNVVAVPINLHLQATPANQPPVVSVTPEITNMCAGSSVTLSAAAGSNYLWSTGATTRDITVNTGGSYVCTVTTNCGTTASNPVNITTLSLPAAPVAVNDTIPSPGMAQLTAAGTGILNWYDQPTGGTLLGTGSPFTTPYITTTTPFYVDDTHHTPGTAYTTGLVDNTQASGTYSNTEQSLIFDVYKTMVLESVKVYADVAGQRSIELLSGNGSSLQSLTVNVSVGMNVVPLNFTITPGNGYQLTRHLINGTGTLYRNSGTATIYPMTVPGVMSIIGNTAGNQYYYFCYDWHIHELDVDCTGPRAAADAVVLTTGIAEAAASISLSVYPNPAHNSVAVLFKIPGVTKANVEFVDALGKVHFRQDLNSFNGNFAETYYLDQLAKGVYIIHISSNSKNYYRKLVIE